jgi:hypothetical protein
MADSLSLTREETITAATMRTRLNAFSPAETDLLLKAGYAACDASLRARNFAFAGRAASFDRLPLRTGKT